MSAPSSSKRARPNFDNSDPRPAKYRRCVSEPATSVARERSSRATSEQPVKTGLEASGILTEQSSKAPGTTATASDEDQYAHRAKPSRMTSINEDIARRRLKVANFAESIRKKKAEAKKISNDYSRMPVAVQKGMNNHAGNVCYRLSLLQALLHLPIFVNWALDHLDPEHCVADNQKACLSCCLRLLTQEYWSGARRSQELTKVLLGMDEILKKWGWRPDSNSGHADPDEQAMKLFEILRAELPTETYSMLEAATQIVTTGVVACGKCGHESRTLDNRDSSFSLPISPKIPNGSVSTYLEKYINETVDGYKCDSCKETSNAKKYQEISLGPEILVIQLKRFDHDRKKDKSAVTIDHTLNLNNFRERANRTSLRYELKAVIKHSGTSNFGHYICSAAGPDGKWYTFDDWKKTVSTPEAATDGKNRFTPYILYYQRKRKVGASQAQTSLSS